jgi:tRNA threonylcarbamoyl adenosine modification protein YeaZ
MKILAVEFSSAQRSVAIALDGRIRAQASEIAGRATHALALIEQALAEARLAREEIECLAIGIGPGSYTGIRAAIALGQGWQMARGVKLLGISSAECLAKTAQANGILGTVHVVIDAQRQELYFARYEINATKLRETSPLKLASVEEVRAVSSPNGKILGAEATRWFENGRLLFPEAATLAELAAERTDFIAGEKMEPIYLRETSFVKAPPPRLLPAE